MCLISYNYNNVFILNVTKSMESFTVCYIPLFKTQPEICKFSVCTQCCFNVYTMFKTLERPRMGVRVCMCWYTTRYSFHDMINAENRITKQRKNLCCVEKEALLL